MEKKKRGGARVNSGRKGFPWKKRTLQIIVPDKIHDELKEKVKKQVDDYEGE